MLVNMYLKVYGTEGVVLFEVNFNDRKFKKILYLYT